MELHHWYIVLRCCSCFGRVEDTPDYFVLAQFRSGTTTERGHEGVGGGVQLHKMGDDVHCTATMGVVTNCSRAVSRCKNAAVFGLVE